MSITRTCDRCGTVVPSNAPDNLCLRCLFDTAVDFDEVEAPGATNESRGNTGPGSVAQNSPPPIFGDYELLGELGRGGQGVVYRARHRGLGRLVALKTIPPTYLAGPHARERFRLEASTASRLDHPNIVPIYEVGESDGFCFYSMKLVEGGSLARRIANDELPMTNEKPAARGSSSAEGEAQDEGDRSSGCKFDIRHSTFVMATLVAKVAHAVHHAHQRGVLHRDLKPSNILLDHEDEPHVSDFGLARLTGEDSSLTLSHAIIGTPAYLPPEIIAAGAHQATVAADIYGLGAILYQLLSGQPPFVRATIAETLRAVQEENPPRPCKLNPAVPADLETICLKCLEKEPAKRYGTAQELAGDLARFLRDEPILARPASRAERVWRWCRRKPALAGSLAVAAVLLLAVLIGSPIAVWRIEHERQRAENGESAARISELKARQIAYASDMKLAHQAVKEDDFGRALQLLERYMPVREMASDKRRVASQETRTAPASDTLVTSHSSLATDLRGWEWRYLWRQCQGEERFILGEHTGGATAVGMLKDGKTVFSAGKDKYVRLWDLESRRQIRMLPHAEEVIGAAASPDGRWLATASSKYAEGQPVLLWDLATQKAVPLTADFWLCPGSITFSPDSKWLAFGTMWMGVRLWDVNTRSEVVDLPAPIASSWRPGFAFSPDSRTLAYHGNENGAILLWDIASRSESRLTGHESAVSALAFSPGGQSLVSASEDKTARLWNLADRSKAVQFPNPGGGVTSVAFSPPDGGTLAMCGQARAGRVIRLFDIETGKQKAELRGHRGDISGLAFTPDGQTLLSASDDGTIRVWDPAPRVREKPVHLFAPNSISTKWSSYGDALFLSPDGRHLLTVYTGTVNSGKTFSVWDTMRLAEGKRHPLPFPDTEAERTWIAAVAAGGRLAAFGSKSGEVMLWDVETGRARPFARLATNKTHRLVFSLDGRYLAAADNAQTISQKAGGNDPRRTVRVWDVGTGKETHVLSPDGEFPWSLTFSADSRMLMAGCWKGQLKLWKLDGQREATTIPGNSGGVQGLALLPDGQTLISAAGSLRFWDVETRKENAPSLSPGARANCLALSADGRRLAAGAIDGRITIWDVASHQEVATLEGHEESVRQLAFTPDGNHLVSVSKDQLRVWRAAAWAEADATGKEAGK